MTKIRLYKRLPNTAVKLRVAVMPRFILIVLVKIFNFENREISLKGQNLTVKSNHAGEKILSMDSGKTLMNSHNKIIMEG